MYNLYLPIINIFMFILNSKSSGIPAIVNSIKYLEENSDVVFEHIMVVNFFVQ